jgi:hypothetical protein
MPGTPTPVASYTPGGTPLNADGTVNIGATKAPATIGAAYGGVSPTDQDVINAANAYKGPATAPVDEDAIRANVMQNLQAEIDATNGVYAQKLADAQATGANLLGSTAATNARRGLLGSDFGTANDYAARAKNTATYNSIDADRQAAISSIIEKGQTEATNEVNQKLTAQKQNADAYISFLNSATSRQDTRTTNAAQAALSAGIDLSSVSDATIKAIADSYQIDPTALVSAYVSAKNALAKTQADIQKPVAVSTSDNALQFNPATSKYEQTLTGTPVDATLKEYQYAVANNGYTGSLSDWIAQKANAKVSISGSRNPFTGGLDTYERSGPGVAGTLPAGSGSTPTAPSAKLPAASGSEALPAGSSPKPQASSSTGSPTSLVPLPTPTTKFGLQYEKDFTSGKTATQVNSLNTAIGHLFDANSIFSGLNNGAVRAGNSLTQYLNTQTGQAAAQNYKQAQDLLSTEIANAYGAGALGDRETQAQFGSAIDSPQQHAGYVKTVATFLSSKIGANVQSYRTAMGQNPSSLDIFISPANQVKLAAMGVNVSALVPGLSPSAYTQQLISGAQISKTTGQVRIPDGKGGYQLLQ